MPGSEGGRGRVSVVVMWEWVADCGEREQCCGLGVDRTRSGSLQCPWVGMSDAMPAAEGA
jgi:hypothetical protein